MDLNNIPLAARSFIERLAALPQVERIVLFGSRAVGDNEPRADIDLAISAPGLTRGQFAELRVKAFESPCLYWLSLVHWERTPDTLKERISQQGRVLYEHETATG
jgi:hypothetical protein